MLKKKRYESKNIINQKNHFNMKYFKSKIKRFEIREVATDYQRAKISSSQDAADYARQFYDGSINVMESMFLMTLNNSNNTTGFTLLSQGGITGTLVDVRLVAFTCLNSLAVGCILVHNHPSGTLKPSEADKAITKKVQKALELIDVKVLDHIILTEDNYFSFANEGLINR